MPPKPPRDGPFADLPHFQCSWLPTGRATAEVWAAGELDIATVPALEEVLGAATAIPRLVVLDVEDLTFVDGRGLESVARAARTARASGGRLAIASLSRPVEALLRLTGVPDGLDVVQGTDADLGRRDSPGRNANPVNAKVMTARVMAVEDRCVWLQTEDDAVDWVWAPGPLGAAPEAGRPVRLFLDARGDANGWWDPVSRTAVNQRHLDRAQPPQQGREMVCQGTCGLSWTAPAAELLAQHDERCLTCAGPLALG